MWYNADDISNRNNNCVHVLTITGNHWDHDVYYFQIHRTFKVVSQIPNDMLSIELD